MIDLLMIETGEGGDIVLEGNDLLQDYNFETMIYLSLFGGYSYWANGVALEGTQEFTSLTERTMQEVSLNSAGRLKIENAVKSDLSFLTEAIPGTTLSVVAKIVSDDKIEIEIKINNTAYTLYFVYPGQLIFERANG